MEIFAKNLQDPDQSSIFPDGSNRSTVLLKTVEIGLGTYQPGWQWSLHAGPQTGKISENHVGYIVSGYMMIQGSDGSEKKVGPGDGFEVSPGHDAWVVGKEPCIALDFTDVQTLRK